MARLLRTLPGFQRELDEYLVQNYGDSLILTVKVAVEVLVSMPQKAFKRHPI